MSTQPVPQSFNRRQAGDAFRSVVERQLSFYVPGIRVLNAKGPTYGDHESGSPHQPRDGQRYDELGEVTARNQFNGQILRLL